MMPYLNSLSTFGKVAACVFSKKGIGPDLFGIIPRWYEFLPSTTDTQGHTVPCIQHLSDVWLILAAIIEILLRIAALAAVVFIIYGGITYSTSQGSPEQTNQAKSTLISALVGLGIAISAATIVAFLADQF